MSGSDLDPEDAKLVTLARSARARAGGGSGAAVRDADGRTYVAAAVDLPALQLSAVQAVVAVAAASGQTELEAVAVVGAPDQLAAPERAVLADVGISTVLLADPDGRVRARD